MTTTPAIKELELKFKGDQGKAVIEGMTSVPFQTLVALILQRKVGTLFKKWGNDPIIVTSEVLTSLASAPQDNRENRTKLITVTLGVGVLLGVFVATAGILVLEQFEITVGNRELWIVSSVIAAVLLLGYIVGRLQRVKQGEKLVDTMEKISGMFS